MVTHFLGRKEHGGGALRAVLAVAEEVRSHRWPVAVHFLSSGSAEPELADRCAERGIRLQCFDRESSSISLILPCHPDRLIIRQRGNGCPPALDDRHITTLAQTLGRTQAVASVSSRDPLLISATLALCNGARRYFQPSGALGREETLYLQATVDGVVANFAEWCRLAEAINLAPPGCNEDAPEAAERTATLLGELHRRGVAGKAVAVCTLGRQGSLVADFRQGQAYRIAVEPRNGNTPLPVTPPGTGDLFLAHWLLYRELWALNGDHLRDPEAAVAMRASHAVARRLGLDRDQYDVRAVPLNLL